MRALRSLVLGQMLGLMLGLNSSICAAQTTPGAPAAPVTVTSAVAMTDYATRYAQTCAACHGAQGQGAANLAPALAGQPSFYAITQLFLYKGGRRNNEAMTAIAKDFTNDDLRGFSDLIGKMPAVASSTASAPDVAKLASGKALSQQHMCGSCHGADFAGSAQVPRLAGQHEDHLLRVLQEFRSGKRLGYTGAMNEALSGLKADDLEALSHYLAQHPGK
jgi:cytochrome c553